MEKTTGNLASVLKQTSPKDMNSFLKENQDSMITEPNPFSHYMRKEIKIKGLTQQDVFKAADLSESFGYKLISGERRTNHRDIILRLCLGCRFDLIQTQKALQLYGFAPLYPKLRRDALIIVQINQEEYDIYVINAYLQEYGEQPLQNTVQAD